MRFLSGSLLCFLNVFLLVRSKDPFDAPIIDNRFLSDPAGVDVAVLAEGVETVLDIVDNAPV